jgi:hypothetical protein
MKTKNSRFIDEFDVSVLMLLGNDWEARISVEYTDNGWEVVGVQLGAVFNGSTMSRFARAAEVDLDSLSQVDRDHLDATVRAQYDGDL